MMAFAVFRRCLREQLRDRWSLVLSVTTAAFFVALYWSLTGGGSTTYRLMVLDRDATSESRGAIAALREMKYATGQSMLEVVATGDREQAVARIRDREALALVVLEPGFARALGHPDPTAQAPTVTFVGDLTHPLYVIAVVMANSTLESYGRTVSGAGAPVRVAEEALGGSADRTEFEGYVPGLLIVAIVMGIFAAAMSIAREVEAGTLKRLALTRMTAFDYLAGTSATQVLIAVLSLLCAFGTAAALGFRSAGPLWLAVLVGAVTSLAVVGMGLVVACLARTVTRAFLIANVPLMLLMFFSGAIYPLPKVVLFRLADHTVGLWDILPSTHAVVAMNKVLSLGVGPTDLGYELGALVGLSALYYAVGVWMFRRAHLAPA
jgi:ABC-2 type transport system permease protein